MLKKVISGGQVGSDIAGLRAARDLGIETGGYMPKGFRTLYGGHPEYAEIFGVQETTSRDYPPRTAMNVRESDATLRAAHDFKSRGEVLTKKLCDQYEKPCFDLFFSPTWGDFGVNPEDVASWLEDVEILNVAGNATKDLEVPVYEFLNEVFKLLIKE